MEPVVLIWVLMLAAVECGRRALIRSRTERAVSVALLGRTSREKAPSPSVEQSCGSFPRWLGHLPAPARYRLSSICAGVLCGLAGSRLVGPLGLVAGVTIGAVLPRFLHKRKAGRVTQELERQLAEIAETTAMAVRSGFSIGQALEFAAEESVAPMSEVLGRFMREQHLGTPFEEALRRLSDELGTPDANLFTLVVTIHAKSGGNLAGALDEVSGTIRHRIAVRRELRALSAQGRISGSVLGTLPLAFFVVLAATSHHDLAPVYRSPAGVAMITAGLVMEALAFLWIRHLLRVEA